MLYDLLLSCLAIATNPYNVETGSQVAGIDGLSLVAAGCGFAAGDLSVGIEQFENGLLVLPVIGNCYPQFIHNRVGIGQQADAVGLLFRLQEGRDGEGLAEQLPQQERSEGADERR